MITVLEGGRSRSFTFEQLLEFHAGNSPGGVAHAFKVMELGFPLLDPGSPPERGEVFVATAFGGPGARDAFEAVTGAVGEGRYTVDPALARPRRGTTLERFVFRLTYRDRSVTLSVREGFVTHEFIALASKDRNPEEEALLDGLKAEMAELVMSHPAAEVYAVDGEDG